MHLINSQFIEYKNFIDWENLLDGGQWRNEAKIIIHEQVTL